MQIVFPLNYKMVSGCIKKALPLVLGSAFYSKK